MSAPEKPSWGQGPAIGVVLARLADLYARALRVEMARRTQAIERLSAMLKAENAP